MDQYPTGIDRLIIQTNGSHYRQQLQRLQRRMYYLSFIRINTLPASSLALDSTTLLAYSSSFMSILSTSASSRLNDESAEENPEIADFVSRRRSSLIAGQRLGPLSFSMTSFLIPPNKYMASELTLHKIPSPQPIKLDNHQSPKINSVGAGEVLIIEWQKLGFCTCMPALFTTWFFQFSSKLTHHIDNLTVKSGSFIICCALNEKPEAGMTPRRSPARPPGAME
ncbi:hypothetical protein C4D60_Mb01t05980 [Musa balbisiana]|uniref:Uncharacterized protein n=1 Tax=Musa balbisiana TaxID=52838 RepID=A0A4S8JK65_MUSBA|nr:hypothetical protein C4D60_Mb01t05980 [Musa balbisiana]